MLLNTIAILRALVVYTNITITTTSTVTTTVTVIITIANTLANTITIIVTSIVTLLLPVPLLLLIHHINNKEFNEKDNKNCIVVSICFCVGVE